MKLFSFYYSIYNWTNIRKQFLIGRKLMAERTKNKETKSIIEVKDEKNEEEKEDDIIEENLCCIMDCDNLFSEKSYTEFI
jgi:hypothetical protein